MLQFIKNAMMSAPQKHGHTINEAHIDCLAEQLCSAIDSPEFAAHYERRVGRTFLPHQVNNDQVINLLLKMENHMGKLTVAMGAAIAALSTQLKETGLTEDQVTTKIHEIVDPEVKGLSDQLAAIASSEKDDSEKLTEVTAAVTAFTDAFAPPTTTGTGDTGTGTSTGETGAGSDAGTSTDTGAAA